MKRIASLTLAAALIATPVLADDKREGLSLMEQGARLLLQGIMQEMEPAMEDLRRFSQDVEPGLRQFVEEMGPALGELMRNIDDFTAYHPPELLPNGDIILRRKTPLELDQDTTPEGGEIEL
jgi:hypothetical protein